MASEDSRSQTATNDLAKLTLASVNESFLLIVRTDRIVTAHVATQSEGYDMNEYRRIHGVSSI